MSDPHAVPTASPWVVRFAPLIGHGSTVLDVACGRGRHARYLAARGCRVTAVDRDENAVAGLANLSGIAPFLADLEAAPWPFAPASFDAVVVVHYLHRPLFPHIIASLRPGGILLYETFMRGNERFGKPSNPHFLLQPMELLAACNALCVIAFEQGIEQAPTQRAVQRIAAAAPAASLSAPAAGTAPAATALFALPPARQMD